MADSQSAGVFGWIDSSPYFLLQVFQPDVPQFQFHRLPHMHLEAEQAAHCATRRIIVHRLRHQMPVENVSERIPARDDVDLIPIVGFDQRLCLRPMKP